MRLGVINYRRIKNALQMNPKTAIQDRAVLSAIMNLQVNIEGRRARSRVICSHPQQISQTPTSSVPTTQRQYTWAQRDLTILGSPGCSSNWPRGLNIPSGAIARSKRHTLPISTAAAMAAARPALETVPRAHGIAGESVEVQQGGAGRRASVTTTAGSARGCMGAQDCVFALQEGGQRSRRPCFSTHSCNSDSCTPLEALLMGRSPCHSVGPLLQCDGPESLVKQLPR